MPNTPQHPETTRPTHRRKTSSIGSIFDQNSALFKQDPEAVKAKMKGLMEFIEKDNILQTIEEFASFNAATQDTLDSMVKLHRENPAKDTKVGTSQLILVASTKPSLSRRTPSLRLIKLVTPDSEFPSRCATL